MQNLVYSSKTYHGVRLCFPQLVNAQVKDFGLSLYQQSFIFHDVSSLHTSPPHPPPTAPNQPNHLQGVHYWSETFNRSSRGLSRYNVVMGFQLQTCAQWQESRALSHWVIKSFSEHGGATVCLGAEGLKAKKTQPRPSIRERSGSTRVITTEHPTC